MKIATGNDITTEATVIVLGTPESLTNIEQSEFSTAIEATERWSYRLQNNLYNRVRNLTDDQSFKEMRIDGHTVQESDLGEQAVLTARHTLFHHKPIPCSLLQRRRLNFFKLESDLVSLSMWGQMAGDFFAWKDGLSPSLIMQVSDKYEVGEADDSWLHLRLWLSNNPWYWLIGFILVVFVVSLLIYLLLKREINKCKTHGKAALRNKSDASDRLFVPVGVVLYQGR